MPVAGVQNSMKIVVTIPAYNEEKTVGSVIREIHRVLNKTEYNFEVLVVDDGSSDRTKEMAERAGAIVYSNKTNIGLAKTFVNEMKYCLEHGADIIIHTDADAQYPAKYMLSLINKAESGYDLVLGSRFGKGKYAGPIVNAFGNRAFAVVLSRLIKKRVTDTTTGLRAFTKEVAKLPITNKFTYTQEQLIRAKKEGFKIGEVYIRGRRTRQSKLFKNPFDYAIKAWMTILRLYRDFEPLSFFGGIGLLLFSGGATIGVYFVYLHVTSGIKGHIGLLFLMLILLFTGLQIVLFGFLADMLQK